MARPVKSRVAQVPVRREHMADEHSCDIVSKIDLQEVLNSVQQATKEISQRFDFKGSKSSIELNKEKHELTVISDDDLKLKTVLDILQTKLVKRGISLKALQYGKVEQASGGTVRQLITLQQGIPVEKAKEIVKIIKETKLKVQAEIQKDQVRLKGKKIDDLQAIMKILRERDLGIHIDFSNYR
jgi:cyclic-di-GMP-binding protein